MSILGTVIVLWVILLLAFVLAVFAHRNENERTKYFLNEFTKRFGDAQCPPATIIVPVKGPDQGLAENLAALASQDYSDYELIVAARSADDIPAGVVPEKGRVVLAGEGDGASGEKVNNLLAGVAAARVASQVLAFADSDGKVQRGWLRALAAALARDQAGAATSYRWHLPKRSDFWNRMRSVWDGVIYGGFHGGDNLFAWGGAMAIRRADFERLRVAEFWRGAISDDYRLSEAVHAAGLQIVYAPGGTVPCLEDTTGREFLSWATRQMQVTRAYAPKLWRLALVSHAIYCAALPAALGLALSGHRIAMVVLGLQWTLGMMKGHNRASLAAAALPLYRGWFDRNGWVHTWWAPLAAWVWLYVLLRSASSDVIEWRGYRYRMRDGRAERLLDI